MVKGISKIAIVLSILILPLMGWADDVQRITVQELKAKMDKGESVVVLDVRTTGSWMSSHEKIKGAVRISINALEARLAEIPKGSEVITYCT